MIDRPSVLDVPIRPHQPRAADSRAAALPGGPAPANPRQPGGTTTSLSSPTLARREH